MTPTILAALTVCAAHVNGGQLMPVGYLEVPVQPKILQELRHSFFEDGYEDCDKIVQTLLAKAVAEAEAKEKAREAAEEAKLRAQARKDHPVLAAALKEVTR